MLGFIVSGRGRLIRNPMTVTAADSQFAKICLMNDDAFYVELWFHISGNLGRLVDENLTTGTEISVKAEVHPKTGKLRYLRSPGQHVFLITEMQVDGKTFAAG